METEEGYEISSRMAKYEEGRGIKKDQPIG
jgi:hypothetical protein